MKLSYLKHTCILAFAMMCVSFGCISACAEEDTGAGASEAAAVAAPAAAVAETPQTEAPQPQTEAPQVQTEAPQVQTEAQQVQTEAPQVQTEAPQTQTESTQITMPTTPQTETQQVETPAANTAQNSGVTSQITGGTTAETEAVLSKDTAASNTSNSSNTTETEQVLSRNSTTAQTEAPTETQASSSRVYAESEALIVSEPANLNVGTETAAEWESTLPELTGVWRDDILNIARSQMGYKESTTNYVTSGGSVKGYTRYGAWYGIPYGDWCAMFASFCIYYAGVPTDQMPLDASTASWIQKLTKLGQYQTRASGYCPQPGDLIFFARDGVNVTHVGLVEEVVTDSTNRVTQIVTIEGNSSNMVKNNAYLPNDTYILGYGIIPDQPADSLPLETVSTTTISQDDVLSILEFIKIGLELQDANVEEDEEFNIISMDEMQNSIADIRANMK